MSSRSGWAHTVDAVGVWWQVDGDGPAVVLLPGRGDSSDLFPFEFTDTLIDAGLSVVRIDPRDTGLSGDGGDRYRLAEMADDVITVCDAIGAGRVQLVAVSMGGMIAIDLAVRHPARIASLVLLAAMSPDPMAGIGEAFFDGLEADPVAGTLAAMGTSTHEDERWVRRRLETARQRAGGRPDAGIRHQAAAFRLGWCDLADLSRLAMPALIVHGTADRVLPTAHAEAFADGLRNSRLHLVDGMGHLPTRSEWIDIANLIVGFIGDTVT